MGNVSISTNIERLQPPYKVIMHGNKIGVQIGVQTVTSIDNETQKIKNRNFPLVAVEKRDYTSSGETLFIDGNGEGRVWDNVETHKVSELFTLGSTITWEDFLSYIWLDEAREDDENAPLKTHLIFQKIFDYKCKFILPSFGLHIIHLHSRKYDNKPHTIYSAENDTFALKVQWCDNLDKMVERIISNLHDYLHIISPNHKATMWTVKYETNEEQLRPLVEKLNANIQATSFKNVLVGTFELVAIPTYEDEKETLPSATPQQEDYSKSNVVFKETVGEREIDMKVFHPSINTEEVYNSINKISMPKLGDKAKCYAFYRVISEIKWLKKNAKQKDILKWWSEYFGCEWHNNNQLKFSDLPDAIKNAVTTDKWKNCRGNNNIDYYNYAQELKKVFVWNMGSGIYQTKSQFIKKGCLPPEKCI